MRRLIVLFAFLSSCLSAQKPIFSLAFDEVSGDTVTTEIVSGTQLKIRNRASRPERIPAPDGSALRLDGYSTYLVANDLFAFAEGVNGALAVEAWYATEAFNADPAGLISQLNDNSGFQLAVDRFGTLTFTFHAEGVKYELASEANLPVYRWNHVVAQVDATAGIAEIFLNGTLVATRSIPSGSGLSLSPASAPLFVGRTNALPSVNGFVTSTLNGALDAVRLFDGVFTAAEVERRFSVVGPVEADLSIDPAVRHPDDHLRPRYHFMPATLWANEAYGFTWYNDRYHLFFQKNPNAAILNFMHWGHLSSPDLVEWEEEPIPLRPQPGWSSVGAWSGTTFFDRESGEPVIAYTGVNGAYAGIGIATSSDPDLVEWEPLPANPVIERAPENIPNLDFRDPYIWTEDGKYYMVVGSGRANNGGGMLLSYTSDDYVHWTPIDPIFEAPSPTAGGIFWEMPYFAPLNDTAHLLVVTPQFQAAPARTIYWVGSFDGQRFEPYDLRPKEFELIERNLLSPAIGMDEAGHLTYIGIIPEDRNVRDQIRSGWRQTFSVPRVLRLLDDGRTLGHYPHPNLCRARATESSVTDRIIVPGTIGNLPEYRGTQAELQFDLYTAGTERFTISVFQSPDGNESTKIVFDRSAGTIGLDRRESSPYETAEILQEGAYAFRENDSLRVSIFLDNSILEVFVDNVVALSARVYPAETSNHIDLTVDSGTLELVAFQAWDRGVKEQRFPDESCPPGLLPDDLSTDITEILSGARRLSVYPNPATDRLNVDLPVSMQHGPLELRLINSNGQVVQADSYVTTRIGSELVITNLAGLSRGVVYGLIFSEKDGWATFNAMLK